MHFRAFRMIGFYFRWCCISMKSCNFSGSLRCLLFYALLGAWFWIFVTQLVTYLPNCYCVCAHFSAVAALIIAFLCCYCVLPNSNNKQNEQESLATTQIKLLLLIHSRSYTQSFNWNEAREKNGSAVLCYSVFPFKVWFWVRLKTKLEWSYHLKLKNV